MSSLKYILNKNENYFIKETINDEYTFSPVDTINSAINLINNGNILYKKISNTTYIPIDINPNYYTDNSGKIYSVNGDYLYSSIGDKIDSILTENKTKYATLKNKINKTGNGNFKKLNYNNHDDIEIETEGEV